MSERRSDRVLSIVLSILVHAAIIAALIWGWWQYRSPKPAPQTLAIEANVVHDNGAAANPEPAPVPQTPPPEPTPPEPTPTPPPPTPPPDAQAEQRAVEEQEAAAQREREEAAAKLAAQRKAELEAEEQARAEAQVKAEAEAKAKAEAEAKAKADMQAKALAERKAEELAQQRKAEQERAQREADLRAQLQAEEHLDAARTNGALAQYQALIAARIERAWIRPPSAHAGINCQVNITQVPGGEVTVVQVGKCNGDEAVRQSIETAAYRASPLPAPPDPALFDRDVVVTFAPHD
ncbi:MAG: cell envelope integrity protein TolA [Steroidobacteraceae bacterium]|jgi:colicin import membrane protein